MQTSVKAIDRARPDPAVPATVVRRRLAVAGLSLATAGGLLALILAAFAPGGLSPAEWMIVALFLVTLPAGIAGFWNAAIGFVLMRFSRDPLAAVLPAAARDDPSDPVTARTAILSCIRNEDVDAVFARLAVMLDDLGEAGLAGRVDLFVLSDTNQADVAAREETAFARLKARYGDRFRLVYRRRETNEGYKAGNIRDFAARWGAAYDYALPLDADSFMSAAAMARLVRIMHRSPEIGILQGLVVGLPADSPFARIFQFGMRLGMRSHTMGAAWWQADCGPYWGHNALIRLAPFMAHCDMPTIPGKGPLAGDVLSHDQVEAVLMRRAGYEVRVLPVEDDSYEENPPTLVEFVRRDLRWCAGNMQYLFLLGMDGLKPVSRVQLFLAIMMFAGPAAWMGMVALFSLGPVVPEVMRFSFDPAYGPALFLAVMAMVFAPKIATILDVFSSRRATRRFGGPGRMAAAVAGEVVFFAILAPATAFSIALFMAALPFGRRLSWPAQQRAAHGLPVALAVRRFWPHTLAGVLLALSLMPLPLGVKLTAAPLLLGLCGVVPFALLTASPAFGRLLAPARLFAVPEEFDPPVAVRRLSLTALAHAGHHAAPAATRVPAGATDAVNP